MLILSLSSNTCTHFNIKMLIMLIWCVVKNFPMPVGAIICGHKYCGFRDMWCQNVLRIFRCRWCTFSLSRYTCIVFVWDEFQRSMEDSTRAFSFCSVFVRITCRIYLELPRCLTLYLFGRIVILTYILNNEL